MYDVNMLPTLLGWLDI